MSNDMSQFWEVHRGVSGEHNSSKTPMRAELQARNEIWNTASTARPHLSTGLGVKNVAEDWAQAQLDPNHIPTNPSAN